MPPEQRLQPPPAELENRAQRQPVADEARDILIRPMRTGEEAMVSALAMRVFTETVAPGYSPQGVAEFAHYAETKALLERLQANHFVLVADSGNELVGVVEARQNRHIAMLFVSPSVRGQGVGASLVRQVVRLCQMHDRCVPEITVHSAPGAVAFYRRLGFQEQGPEQVSNGIRFVPMSLRC